MKEVKEISDWSSSRLMERLQEFLDQGWDIISIYHRYSPNKEVDVSGWQVEAKGGWHYAWLTREKEKKE